MSGELEALVLESLAEEEKDAVQIRYWIEIRRHITAPDMETLEESLDGLEAAGLIEAYRQHMVPKVISDSPLWVYRLTADGALKQWTTASSVPEEMSPA